MASKCYLKAMNVQESLDELEYVCSFERVVGVISTWLDSSMACAWIELHAPGMSCSAERSLR